MPRRTYREKNMSERVKRRTSWLKEWLGFCIAFAAILLVCAEIGQYDHIERDTFFLTAISIIYLVCCAVAFRYFRQPR